jgi:hypothetical protein
MARFFIISILFNTVLYCSQRKPREIPETRMVVWEPPVVDVIKAQVQKEKKPAQRKFRLSVPQHHFATAVREDDFLDRMMERLKGESRALPADSKQEAETRVVALLPSPVNAKRAPFKRHFSANGVEMPMVALDNNRDTENLPVVQRFQQGNTNVDTRYFVNMFARLQAIDARRDTPIVMGAVNLQQLINNHYSEENRELLLLAANVCAEARRQKLLRGIRAMFADGDQALPLIKTAYLQSGLPIDTKIDGNWTGLHIACTRGHFKNAKFFVQNNADLNVQGPENITPLMCAVGLGHFKIVKMLAADITLDIDAVDEHKETALIKAVNGGNWRIVNVLVLKKASVLIADGSGNTPLQLARIHLERLRKTLRKCSISKVNGSDTKNPDRDSDSDDDESQNKELIQSYEIMINQLRPTEVDQKEAFEAMEAHHALAKDVGFEVIPYKTPLTRSSNNAAPLCSFPEERAETWKYWLFWHLKSWANEVIG